MNDNQSPRDSATVDPLVEYKPSLEPLPRYDTFWRRLGANVVDGVLLMPLQWLDAWMFGSVTQPGVLVSWYIFHSFAFALYSVTLHGLYGQTLGKMLTGVRVLDLSETRLSFRQALWRDSVPLAFSALGVAIGFQTVMRGENPLAAEAPPLLIIIVGLASLGWLVAELVTMLWNDKRRALHDLIARSVVVRTR